jgi:hypothetical protein
MNAQALANPTATVSGQLFETFVAGVLQSKTALAPKTM